MGRDQPGTGQDQPGPNRSTGPNNNGNRPVGHYFRYGDYSARNNRPMPDYSERYYESRRPFHYQEGLYDRTSE